MMLLVERELRDGGNKVPKRVLHITVTREWFKKILAKEKVEDYREINHTGTRGFRRKND